MSKLTAISRRASRSRHSRQSLRGGGLDVAPPSRQRLAAVASITWLNASWRKPAAQNSPRHHHRAMCNEPWNFCPGSPRWPGNDSPSPCRRSWNNSTKPIAVSPVKTSPGVLTGSGCWWEFLHAGFTLADLVQVVRYLQKKSVTPAATSAPSNYPICSNWIASRRTSTSAASASLPNRHPRKHSPI